MFNTEIENLLREFKQGSRASIQTDNHKMDAVLYSYLQSVVSELDSTVEFAQLSFDYFKHNPYNFLALWARITDIARVEVHKARRCPNPVDELVLLRRIEGLENTGGRSQYKPCGDLLCPLCCIRRLAVLDNIPKDKVYTVYRKEYKRISFKDSANWTKKDFEYSCDKGCTLKAGYKKIFTIKNLEVDTNKEELVLVTYLAVEIKNGASLATTMRGYGLLEPMLNVRSLKSFVLPPKTLLVNLMYPGNRTTLKILEAYCPRKSFMV